MAKTTPHKRDDWDTLHNNGPFPLKLLYVTKLGREEMFPSKTERYNDAAGKVQRLIRETQKADEGFRPTGPGGRCQTSPIIKIGCTLTAS